MRKALKRLAVVQFVAFGVIYIFTGEAGREQVRYFLDAYGTTR